MFWKRINIITDHKPLGAIFKKYMAPLSKWFQCIVMRIHQYKIHIIYKLDSHLYIADWLLRQNNTGNEDEEIAGMNINTDFINFTPDTQRCITTKDILATSKTVS